MRYLPFLLPLVTGLLLGLAQCTSRLLLLNKNLLDGFILGGVTAALYLIAITLWVKILKSSLNLSGAYSLVVLGVFTAILMINLFKSSRSHEISMQDITGILLIVFGCTLVKR